MNCSLAKFVQRALAPAGLGALLAFGGVRYADANTYQVPLEYNFNGIWHGEAEAMGDTEASGFRSISDRGLDFSGGVPVDATLDAYALEGAAGELDMVHLGNRNLTDGGNWTFDAAPDGDNIGIQPDWLADVDQSGPSATATTLSTPILLEENASANVLFQVSNGGGAFDVRFSFSSGDDVVATLEAGDWWGGNGLPEGAFGLFDGVGGVDAPTSDAPLGLWEGVIDLNPEAGRTLTGIAFENATNLSAGYGIYGVNVITGAVIPEPATGWACGALLLSCVLRRRTTGRRR